MMFRYIFRRSAYSVLILLGVTLLTFVLFRAAAGDPAATLLGKNPKPREVEALRESLGSDKPLFWGKRRKTEAYTNAIFTEGRTSFTGILISGKCTPRPGGLELASGSSMIFLQNFEPKKHSACFLSVKTDFPLKFSAEGVLPGKEYSPAASCVEIALPDPAPEKITLTALKSGTLIREVRFERECPNPADSQFLASLKEIVSFQTHFPYVSFFNFGNTLLTHESIRGKLWRGMWPSLCLMLPVFLGELFFGMALALIACLWRGSCLDKLILLLSVGGMSISYLALIIFGQWLFGYYWNFFPVWGWGSWRYLILPVAIGIVSGTGSGVRFYRTVFLNEMNREYLRTAVAKGAPALTVYGKHLLRNSLIPIITRASGVLPFLFTGSLLLESFFGIPGLGSAGINALHDADLQMLKALVILSSFLFVFLNLLTDIAYAWVDPRIRPQES